MNYLETVIHMIVVRTGAYLEDKGYEDVYERFPGIRQMAAHLTRQDMEAWAQAGEKETARYRELLEIIGDTGEPDHVLESVLDLCLAQMYAPEFAAFLKYHTGSSVTLALAYGLEGIRFPGAEDVKRKIRGLSGICLADWEASPVLHLDITMDDRILEYLMADGQSPKPAGTWFQIFGHTSRIHKLFVYESLPEEGAAHLTVQGNMVQLSGRGGRRFIAKHMGVCLKKDVIFVSLKDLGGKDGADFRTRLFLASREALLRQGCLCIYHISRDMLKELEMTEKHLNDMVVAPVLKRGIPLILCTDEGMRLWDYGQEDEGNAQAASPVVLRLELPAADYFVRQQVWDGFAHLYHIRMDSAFLAERYRLVPSEISRVLRIWRERCPQNTVLSLGYGERSGEESFEFSRLCYDMVCMGMQDRVGKVIYPNVSMDDLKVSDNIRTLLDQVIASVTGSHQIYEEWQMKQSYPYGRAVTVLLTGPPGTGKTMSAHAIASRLGIPLYQVNLSNVVDKYIGETEKHLEQAFSFAEKTSMVLFFDEADSLFGKRSEVTDAKDRYANTEISYLLQRIEQFDGIAIMATNFINNIDTAFLRRIKYVIRFQQPDEKQRLAIWESCVYPRFSRSDLDLPYLAKQFDFSGGTIKNILLNACAIAVSEEADLTMEHILKAVRNEYIKLERMIDSSIWGEYEYIFT